MFSIKTLARRYATVSDGAPAGRAFTDEERPKGARLSRRTESTRSALPHLERQVPARTSSLEKEEFQHELQSFRRTNLWCIVSLVAVLTALIAGTGVLIYANSGNGVVVASTFAGFGTLTGALTTFILALFRMKGQADMLRLLSGNLDPATVQTILNILAK